MAPKLFVRRGALHLVERIGEVIQVRKMPRVLSKSPLTAEFQDYSFPEFPNDSLPVKRDKQISDTLNKFNEHFHKHISPYNGTPKRRRIPALWSGYRSCVVIDKTGQMFRLKGIAFNKKKPETKIRKTYTRVEGGQLLRNAENEHLYSDRFNEVLRNEGIVPPMEYAGMDRYPIRVDGDNLAASIIRIEGDTRLDELFYVCERLYLDRKNNNGARFLERTSELYFDLGFIVGRLKKLMDKNGQTWSDNSRRSNANIGNVVLYSLGRSKVGVGLVDFDASCDIRDKSESRLKYQQKREHKNFLVSTTWNCTSLRQIGDYKPVKPLREVRPLRLACAKGFASGYDVDPAKIHHTIELGQIYDAFGISTRK